MSSKIDRKEILDGLTKEERDRRPTTLYLSKKLYQQFQRACGDVAASRVIERLIKTFIDDEGAKGAANARHEK